SYTATASPGGLSKTGPGSPLTVTGLTNGQAYTFTVTATNGEGAGPASAPSAPVTPFGVPVAPQGIGASAGNRRITVGWAAAVPNGSPVTGYVVTPYVKGSAQTPTQVGNVTTTVVTGLTNGVAYSFRVAGINAAGTGAQS